MEIRVRITLNHVPMAVMDSILQLSQYDNVLLDDIESALRRSRQSQLTDLYTFGFVRMGYYPVPPAVKDMTEIAALIVHSTSQTPRRLIDLYCQTRLEASRRPLQLIP
jgi:hypothetical protein